MFWIIKCGAKCGQCFCLLFKADKKITAYEEIMLKDYNFSF